MLADFWSSCDNVKSFLCKLWLATVPETCLIKGYASSVSNFKLGFPLFSQWLVVENGLKVGILDILWYYVHRTISFRVQGCDELIQLVDVLASIVFHETVKNTFQGSYCTFRKCSLSLSHCKANIYSFSFAQLLKLFSKFCALVKPKFRWSTFCKHSQKGSNSFIFFVFIRFASTVLPNALDELVKTFTLLL